MTQGAGVAWVVDASVALRWAFEDQASPETEALLDRVATDDVLAPAIWRYEVANAFVRSAREGRLSGDQALARLDELTSLPVMVEPSPDRAGLVAIAGLALRLGLRVPDAAYLHLAVGRGAALATLDRALARAAGALGVAVLPAPA